MPEYFDINTPRLFFTSKTISRKIIRDSAEIDDIEWSQGQLIIDDMILGGKSLLYQLIFVYERIKY